MSFIIRVLPARTTPKGRKRGPEYLYRINFPALLSGERPTATLVQARDGAVSWPARTAAESAAELLRSMGYHEAQVVEIH